MFNIWFDCCALAVSVIILISFYTRNQIPILQNRVFIYQVWCMVATTSCNLILGIMQNGAHAGIDSQSLIIMNVTAFFYHTLRMLNAYLYMLYILSVLNILERSFLQFLYLYVPAIISIVICIAGPFWHLVFFIDSSGIHHPGPLMPLLYLIAGYYMLLVSFLVIYYRKAIPLSRRIAFHSFGVLVMGTVFIERLYPKIMVEAFGSVLCQLLIYLTLQKPEEVVDGTTGLLNRVSFLRMVSIRFRQRVPFDLIVIVFDDFTFLERSLGIRVMTTLLTNVGTYIRSITPRGTAYRLSEGTLCVMLPRRGDGYTQRLYKRLQDRTGSLWNVFDLKINLGAYFTLFQCPEDADSVGSVLDLVGLVGSDMHGHHRLETDNSSGQRAKEVENALADALRNQSFEVYYQPIYSVSKGRFHSAEALVRLNDKNLGPIGPDEFIPIAEKSGMIVKIDQFVLEEVCRFIAETKIDRMGIDYIEVNLSIVDCLQETLADNILDTLKRYGIPSRFINLELTETASEVMPETVVWNITRLAANGICFSLDDYGTGYSNIGRILTMPVDIIKLDKMIVQTYFSLENSEADIVMVETLNMLKKLDKSIVAEGVETSEQADRLIQMGCEFLQGYYYARPMPAQKFLEIISALPPCRDEA